MTSRTKNLEAPDLAAATERDARWQAVLARDPTADGTFCFAVRTTGVYCRPSCGARRPRAENVLFFRDAAAAARA
ncbi:MAG TPA: Ada metal-binding domain-containing protein, partial [Planctomycetota bacterium]|nr:Ada metal-binding domain-containing protein [Planctomycetota bacterium]